LESNLVTNATPLKTYFNWSTGKDAALALHYLLQDKSYHVAHLLTSINHHYDRVSMHGLRRTLFLDQMQALGLPFSTIELPEEPSMKEYESRMKEAVLTLTRQGFSHAAFGDIFLEDLKLYREKQLNAYHMKTVFPLWKKDSKNLIAEFINLGFKAILVCIDAGKLDRSFTGRLIDENFLRDLPADVDPCGENGEFHTFCFDGPIFKRPIAFEKGELTYREYNAPASGQPDAKIGFWFCDLIPVRCEVD
jgi:uncharacterized protein (TIGR00290 family)